MKNFSDSKSSLIINYSTNNLISNYTHIGFKKTLTIHSFRKAILGFYSNVTIINPALTLANLKFSLNFFFKLMLKNQRVCFVVHNYPNIFFKKFNFKNQFFFFNCWIPGFITNFKYTRVNSKKGRKFHPYIPAALFLFGVDPQKAANMIKESSRFLVPTFCCIDSNTSPSLFPYWIPINMKSGYVKLFFINFINSVIEKSFLFRKQKFFKDMKSLMDKKNDPDKESDLIKKN